MICDLCKKNTATVRLIAIVDGAKLERNLCASCVAKQRMQLRTEGVQSILSAVIESASRSTQRHPGLHCSVCGTEYDDFLKTNRLGCAQCYHDFREQLKPVLRRLHGHAEHIGRVPEYVNQPSATSGRLERLRRQLEVAVAMEEFEQAAELRDELRELAGEAFGGAKHAQD